MFKAKKVKNTKKHAGAVLVSLCQTAVYLTVYRSTFSMLPHVHASDPEGRFLLRDNPTDL